MAERKNILIGYGERLNSDLASPAAGAPKAHPYSFTEARKRLTPKVKAAALEIADLSPEVCPRDQTVALITLHPTYLAKSYYPGELLQSYKLEAVGSRAREVSPEKWTRKNPPDTAVTSELFVAGHRDRFQQFANDIGTLQEKGPAGRDLIKIEDFRTIPAAEKLKALRTDDPKPLLEVVLHAQPRGEYAFVLDGFEAYLRHLDVRGDFDKRRFFAEGLCFLPVRVPRELVEEVVKFSFLRLAREMPRLRQFRPVARATPGFTHFACRLPDEGPLDPSILVAVFDGGVGPSADLNPWVDRKKTPGLGDAVPEFQNHGTAVTSAVLFGPLQDGIAAARPYAKVDHYRILDAATISDDQGELYTVLQRIEKVLKGATRYDFVNLSLGPDLPIEDNDVHAWTAVIDQLLAHGDTFAAIAVGNSGEADHASGNARIQSPSDCVNGFAVGSCDRTGLVWQRATYSCIGPGRSPGIMKPDGLAFGGSSHEPYWVLNARRPGRAMPITGTSFAAPTALRTAIGVRAHFGKQLSSLAIKALLVHGCDAGEHDAAQVGWGRVPMDLETLVLTDEHTAYVVYQGVLKPAHWLRMPVPTPAEAMNGMIRLGATFCFASATDPQDPLNYTRSGLEVRFRPHDEKRKDPMQLHPDSGWFFQAKDISLDESELRADAHKWETTIHKTRSMRASGIHNPVFDVHYNARTGGRNARTAEKIPYALVVSISAPKMKELYDKVLHRYRTILVPLTPAITIPIRT
jgi:hypothetical protein